MNYLQDLYNISCHLIKTSLHYHYLLTFTALLTTLQEWIWGSGESKTRRWWRASHQTCGTVSLDYERSHRTHSRQLHHRWPTSVMSYHPQHPRWWPVDRTWQTSSRTCCSDSDRTGLSVWGRSSLADPTGLTVEHLPQTCQTECSWAIDNGSCIADNVNQPIELFWWAHVWTMVR